MLIHGKVECKMPVTNQLISLTNEEKNLFNFQFSQDIIQFTNHSPSFNGMMTPLQNPYDIETDSLEKYLKDMID